MATDVFNKLVANRMHPGILRPYQDTSLPPVANAVTGEMEFPSFYTNAAGVAVPTTNATLRKDEWIQLDQAIVRSARDRLVGINFCLQKGLVFSMNGMGKMVLEHETLGEMTAATMTMDGVNRGTKDRANFELAGLPLPIVHKEFDISARVLNASRTVGQPLDTVNGELAARVVAEKLETIFFQGASSYKAAGYTLYGLLDFPNRNTTTLTAHWNDSAATGETILADVLAMKAALQSDGFYGPYVLFVPQNFETALDEDFKANSDKTVRQRLLEIGGLNDIVVADKMTNDYVALVQTTPDVMRVVNGLPITTMQWDVMGGLATEFKVMAIQVPQFRADQSGNCGICVGTK